MTMEIRSLLSHVMLDMSGHRSGNSTLRRPNPVVILTPPPCKPKELPKLVDTSSHVSALDDVEMAEASLEGVLPPSLPWLQLLDLGASLPLQTWLSSGRMPTKP